MKLLFSSIPRRLSNLMHRFPLRGFARIRRTTGTPYVLDTPVIYDITHDYLKEFEFDKKSLVLPVLSPVLFYYDYKYSAGFLLASFAFVNILNQWNRHSLKFIIKTIRYNPLDQLFTIETFNFPEPFLVKARQLIIFKPDAENPSDDYTVRIMDNDGEKMSSLDLTILSSDLYTNVLNVEFFDSLIENEYDEIIKYQLAKTSSKSK